MRPTDTITTEQCSGSAATRLWSRARSAGPARAVVIALLSGYSLFGEPVVDGRSVTVQSRAYELIVTGAVLIDGTGAPPQQGQALLIRGDTIAEIGPEAGILRAAPSATILNLRGKYLLPGLIDSHVHYGHWNGHLYLNYGVTTVFDLGNQTEWILTQKRGVERGTIEGPRIYTTGNHLNGPPNGAPRGSDYGGWVHYVTDEASTRAALEVLRSQGVDAIKIQERLNEEALRTIVAFSEKHDIPVVGHTRNARDATQMGIRFVEHMTPIARAAGAGDAGQPADMRPEMFESLIDLLVAKDVHINPTVLIGHVGASKHRERYHREDLALFGELTQVPEYLKRRWLARYEPDPASAARREAAYRNVAEFLRRFVAKAGKILPGTDAGDPVLPGPSIHREMEMLVTEVGLKPMDVLTANTLQAARFFGKDDVVGSLQVGRKADLLVLHGNPLEEISNTSAIAFVMKGGQIVDRSSHRYDNPIPRPVSAEPPPVIRSIEPKSFVKEAPSPRLTIRGEGFIPDTVVHVAGSVLTPEWIDAKTLRVEVPARVVQSVGTYPVAVFNPLPAGGISNQLHFFVDFPAPATGGSARSDGDTRTLVIRGANALVGTELSVKHGVTLRIRGDRIVSVVEANDATDREADADVVIDARGKWVFPGLIDSHVHLNDWSLRLYLSHGVTTVYDTSNQTEWALAQREGVRLGAIDGPRIYTTGNDINAPPRAGEPPRPSEAIGAGYVHWVRGPEEATRVASDLVAGGVDALKVHDRLSDASLSAVLRVAEGAGLPVVGHTHNALDAAALGVRFVEHMAPIVNATRPAPKTDPSLTKSARAGNSTHLMDVGRFDEVVTALVAKHTYVNPTLLLAYSSVSRHRAKYRQEDETLRRNGPLAFLSEYLREWEDSYRPPTDAAEEQMLRDGLRKSGEFLRRFVRAGGKVVSGTDAGQRERSGWLVPGQTLHRELEMLVEAGLSPMESLRSATVWAAELFGKEEELGSIAPGRLADLVIVDANPLDDIANTGRISQVVKGGKLIDRTSVRYRSPIPRTVTIEPPPRVSAIHPLKTIEGDGDLDLVIRGEGFLDDSVVDLAGHRVRPYRSDSSELRAVVPASLIPTVGTYRVSVVNPLPGGGTSNVRHLFVDFRDR